MAKIKSRKKLFFKRTIACLSCILIIVCGIFYLGDRVRVIEVDRSMSAIDAFHELPKDSVEVMVYGGSRAWRGVNTPQLYMRYGIGAYNYGSNAKNFNTSYLMFKDSMKTQNPKLILIETSYLDFNLRNTDVNAEIYSTKALPNTVARKEYLNTVLGDNDARKLSYYVPLLAFHDNWVNIESKSFEDNSVSYNFQSTKGFYGTIGVTKIHLDPSQYFEQKAFHSDTLEMLEDIVSRCEERGTKIIFFTLPYSGEYNYNDAMKQFAQSHGCDYINLFEKIEEIGIDRAEDFHDENHLNKNGATKVALYLGEYIIENNDRFNISDMRTVEGTIWENEE